jgi:hypothetical protein
MSCKGQNTAAADLLRRNEAQAEPGQKSFNETFNGFITAAALIGAALWFYLIAQVVHIRANKEK